MVSERTKENDVLPQQITAGLQHPKTHLQNLVRVEHIFLFMLY